MKGLWILVIVGFGAIGCSSSGSSTAPEPSKKDAVEVRGQIFGRVLRGQSNPNGPLAPDYYTDPVAGAVVSSSLDATTTVSDAAGNFDLKTNTVSSCVEFALRVSAAGYPTYNRTGRWSDGTPNISYKIALISSDGTDPIVSVEGCRP